MKVAGNKLFHLKDYYLNELTSILEPSEIEALFALAVEHYLNITRTELNFKLNENINQSDLLLLYDCCKAIKKQIPIQYILGEAYFFGLKFYVNSAVLIPRPETEELVDLILKENIKPNSILDIGTGSGCIPIALKKQLTDCEVKACDISPTALNIANRNASFNCTHIDFFECDILSEKNTLISSELKFDIIVSNPPYILDTEKHGMQNEVLNHEPHLALFVEGKDAIIFYRKIIQLCGEHLKAKGKLFFELNPITAEDVFNFAEQSQCFSSVELIKDMSGKKRFLKAIRL